MRSVQRYSSRKENPRRSLCPCLHSLWFLRLPDVTRNEPELRRRAHLGNLQKPSVFSDPTSGGRDHRVLHLSHRRKPLSPRPSSSVTSALVGGSLPGPMPAPRAPPRTRWPRPAQARMPTRPWLMTLTSESPTPPVLLYLLENYIN